MFDALRREIQDILGENFAVFFEYNTNQQNNEQILNEYKNVGVLYVNYGDLKLLEGNKGLTGTLQLELMLSVKESAQLESVVSAPLYNLLSKQNGKFENDGGPYSYVLNYHAPTSTGEIQTTAEGVEYVVYSLPIDVTVSASLTLGEEFEIELAITIRSMMIWTKLNNVVTAVLSYKLSLDSHTKVNGNAIKSSATAKVWGMHAEVLFEATDFLHNEIKIALEENPEKVWNVRYKYKGDSDEYYTTRQVLLHDCTLSFERGQFAVLVLNMCEAD